jgi:bacillopeptidase F (M6 metalloprotease family)
MNGKGEPVSDAESATFYYWTWYNIEEPWDCAYVMASPENGETRIPLNTSSSTAKNPSDNI